ncbi:nitroreductase family deazaflavin-dependent oxidoreductase [Actinoplanes sp. NPDC051470]|uniref:nitroreductase family deazaflavin-dependent oxidoreductase n=1 Tax=Actinoplanes sp. NPDC051470 TaxID=3157224 RepID=UPI00343383B6
MTGKAQRVWLTILKNTLNRGTSRMARAGVGPFSIVRHVGRKTGKVYETPLILARAGDDFVAELTYGPEVAWYRNVVAAGRCVVLDRGAEHEISAIEDFPADAGLRAFGNPAALVLRLLRRREFRLLRTGARP